MAIEIERKFLVNKTIWDKTPKNPGCFFRQGYILTDPAKTIRIRLTDKEGYITIKGLSVGASRPEFEFAIPVKDAEALLDQFCTSDISKIRYEVYFEDKLWEVDEFSGDNEGLIVAELELASEQEKFELPPWAGKEVTGEDQYYNSNLSLKPYKSWETKPYF